MVILSSLLLVLSKVASIGMAGTLVYPPSAFDQIEIDSWGGRIEIEGNGLGRIETRPGTQWKSQNCEVYSEMDGRTLRLKLGLKEGSAGQSPGSECDMTVTLKVPSEKGIELKAENSTLSIESMKGKLKGALKKGHLNVHSTLSELNVRGENSEVRIVGATRRLHLDLDYGSKSVDLELKALSLLSQTQEFTVAMSQKPSGNPGPDEVLAEITLPVQAKVKSRISRIQGREEVSEDQPDYDLKAQSDSVNVRVQRGAGGEHPVL